MEVLTVLAMLVTAAATGVLALYTKHLRDESQKMRELQTTPNLVVYLERNPLAPFVLDVVVKNIGLGPAYDITFNIDSTVKLPGGTSLLDIALFADGQRVITQGQEVKNAFGTHESLEEKDTTIQIIYHAKDKPSDSDAIRESFILNPKQFEGSGYFQNKERDAIIKISDSLVSMDRKLSTLIRSIEQERSVDSELEATRDDPFRATGNRDTAGSPSLRTDDNESGPH